ncbi:hypothetical protein GobsT_42720 [Gemmata obscuriglobus]|uniref:Zinc-finger domain-containing protein n=1 Tax=Gemmata obscuriglobus TaxID=114 RepID=A0A2Z3H087_9BACT|nr:hypothetical protein [Gemmata obscuriglobus]AWM37712.1 hypothetical protein C1280_12410 [Gemmata obscuriglobus]QEG29476.1 hypothetical protein GobsT_42720 [Gemmata obscuriglobus]VTS08625.1 Putative transmembrane anti-sigma factor OS=Pirellula staleyi (strain ATCC 27377 / DSM 6068 / ICPB 4128) GN=Psta_1784 PE=4 SV=1 [Gemmata obscuriglobus UQM 2246]
MSADSTEFDDGPPPDPFEAELVAYLDGELDPAAARRVEDRLAEDPAARARAAELKKSFDLLDYLPRPEPSPNFTTRTLEKLPAVRSPAGSGAGGRAVGPASVGVRSGPGEFLSTSMPIPLAGADPLRPRSRGWLPGTALVAAVVVLGLLGYLTAGAARSLLIPRGREHEEVKTDPRIVALLPLYAVADDLSFVQEIAKPELFGDDPAVSYDPLLKVPAVDPPERQGVKAHDSLAKAFRDLPAARQAEVSKLDRDLHAREPKERDRLLRALEVYAIWLDRLPEPERRGVLGAATPNLRLGVVRDLREQQWVDALPPPTRKKVDSLTSPKEKAELIAQLRDEEEERRERWQFLRGHAEAFVTDRPPWPFDTKAGRDEVTEFARAAFKLDDSKRSRLAPDEVAEYRRALALANGEQAWALYGWTVYELNKAHPYLPEPADPKLMWTETADLPDSASRLLKKNAAFRLRSVAGKWPEFPLELHRELSGPKGVLAPVLGPARVADFKEPVRQFAEKELLRRLTAEEKAALHKLEGKWPDYPREFVRYATKYDLSVPGVTLPGSPKKWEATYGTRPGPRGTN